MLSPLNFFNGPWEKVRGALREDLEHMQIAINHLWGKAFGTEYLLKNDVVDGEGVIKTGEDGHVVGGDVLLEDLEDISAARVLGRRSSSAGPVEELTATTPIAVSGTSVIHNTSGVTAATYGAEDAIPVITVNATGHITAASQVEINATSYVPMTTGWQPEEWMDEHVQIMDNGDGGVFLIAYTTEEP